MLFMIAITSYRTVLSAEVDSQEDLANVTFKILHAVRIMRSKTPPKLLACGGLKRKSRLLLRNCVLILERSMFFSSLDSSLCAPTMLVPFSHLISLIHPSIAIIFLSPFIRKSVLRSSSNSRCTALEARHVTTSTYLFDSLRPSVA